MVLFDDILKDMSSSNEIKIKKNDTSESNEIDLK